MCILSNYIGGDLEQSARRVLEVWESRTDWILRTVRQYERVDMNVTRCKISYDISFAAYSSEISTAPSLVNDRVNCLIPVEVLMRGLLPDFDILSPWPSEVTLAPRSLNTAYATLFLLAKLDRLGVSISKIPESEIDELYRLLLDWKQTTKTVTMFHLLRKKEDEGANQDLSDNDTSWGQWIESEAFRREVAWLTRTYFLCLAVPAAKAQGSCVIKISFLEAGHRSADEEAPCTLSLRWLRRGERVGTLSSYMACVRDRLSLILKRIGIKSPIYTIPLVDFGPKKSLHCRVLIPDEMRVEALNATFLERGSRNSLSYDDIFYEEIVVPHMVSVHCRSKVPAEAYISLTLGMRRSYFSVPAFVISLLMLPATLLMFRQMSYSVLYEPSLASSAVISLSSLVPALAASYLVARKERYEISRSLGIRRAILIFGILATLLLSISYTFGMGDKIVGVSLAVLIYLVFEVQVALLCFFGWDIWRVSLLNVAKSQDGYNFEARVRIGIILWSYMACSVIALVGILRFLSIIS